MSSTRTPQVDGYIRKNSEWSDVLEAMRLICLDAGLDETMKWRTPCYQDQGKNIVLLGAWSQGCVFSFIKGSLLKDEKRVLVFPGPNTQSAKLARFTDIKQVKAMSKTLRALIDEAREFERAGVKVAFKHDMPYPAELGQAFESNPQLKSAFEKLLPGARREYLLHFTSAKQSATRSARIEKHAPMILAGQRKSTPAKR
jgi:uncharacterized protein YdeI (YjbR/CyaY-like superfamily)